MTPTSSALCNCDSRVQAVACTERSIAAFIISHSGQAPHSMERAVSQRDRNALELTSLIYRPWLLALVSVARAEGGRLNSSDPGNGGT